MPAQLLTCLSERIAVCKALKCVLQFYACARLHFVDLRYELTFLPINLGIKALATAKVLEGVNKHYTDEALFNRWRGYFPGEVSDEKPTFEALHSSNELDLDGHKLKAYDVVQGDSPANSFLHVPDLDLVVASDLVYGDCYQHLGEANTKEKRENWIKAVEQIESLNPKVVVPGHKRPSQIPGAYLTESTKEYIRVFGNELEKADSPEALEKRMKELYPHRWNDYILMVACRASFANKGQ